jgi:hypothetical protein
VHHSTFRIAVLFLLSILLALLATGCGRSAATMPVTIPAPTAAAPVEPTATVAREAATAQPAGESGPAPRPAQNTVLSAFTTDDFSGSGTCSLCHEGLSDEAGADVSLTTAWRSTRAATCPRPRAVW